MGVQLSGSHGAAASTHVDCAQHRVRAFLRQCTTKSDGQVVCREVERREEASNANHFRGGIGSDDHSELGLHAWVAQSQAKIENGLPQTESEQTHTP